MLVKSILTKRQTARSSLTVSLHSFTLALHPDPLTNSSANLQSCLDIVVSAYLLRRVRHCARNLTIDEFAATLLQPLPRLVLPGSRRPGFQVYSPRFEDSISTPRTSVSLIMILTKSPASVPHLAQISNAFIPVRSFKRARNSADSSNSVSVVAIRSEPPKTPPKNTAGQHNLCNLLRIRFGGTVSGNSAPVARRLGTRTPAARRPGTWAPVARRPGTRAPGAQPPRTPPKEMPEHARPLQVRGHSRFL